MENCKQFLVDMANKPKTIYMVDQFILVNEKEMGEHLGALLKLVFLRIFHRINGGGYIGLTYLRSQ